MAMGGKARDVSTAYIKLEFNKLKDGIYEIVLPNNIQPGEYAFMPISGDINNGKIKISCFGIN
jgi:hypothetical protein